jgi:hypothetical protein
MSSTVVYSDTEIKQAQLLSQLSARPARVKEDVFVWNGCLIDRATAIVALLKINNHVPVGDSVKLRLYRIYQDRFSNYDLAERFTNINNDDANTAARIWFNVICRTVKGSSELLDSNTVKQILVDLHTL